MSATSNLGSRVLPASVSIYILSLNQTFGKLPLGKLHIWEVSTREVTLGKMPLGNYLTPYSALYEPTWSCQDWLQPFPLLKILTLYKFTSVQFTVCMNLPVCPVWPQPFPLLTIPTRTDLPGLLGSIETYSYILTKIITFFFVNRRKKDHQEMTIFILSVNSKFKVKIIKNDQKQES